jgi:hypothetical protein
MAEVQLLHTLEDRGLLEVTVRKWLRLLRHPEARCASVSRDALTLRKIPRQNLMRVRMRPFGYLSRLPYVRSMMLRRRPRCGAARRRSSGRRRVDGPELHCGQH